MAIFISYQFVICFGIWFHGSLFEIKLLFLFEKAAAQKGKEIVHPLAHMREPAGVHTNTNSQISFWLGFMRFKAFTLVHQPVKQSRKQNQSVKKKKVHISPHFCQYQRTPCTDPFFSWGGLCVRRAPLHVAAINLHSCSLAGPFQQHNGKIGFPPMAIRTYSKSWQLFVD